MKICKRDLGKDSDSAKKTLKYVLCLVIHRIFLAEFTWTGKSKPGFPRKKPFQIHEGLISLLLSIVSEFHPNYAKGNLREHLVSSIFKTAYE